MVHISEISSAHSFSHVYFRKHIASRLIDYILHSYNKVAQYHLSKLLLLFSTVLAQQMEMKDIIFTVILHHTQPPATSRSSLSSLHTTEEQAKHTSTSFQTFGFCPKDSTDQELTPRKGKTVSVTQSSSSCSFTTLNRRRINISLTQPAPSGMKTTFL